MPTPPPVSRPHLAFAALTALALGMMGCGPSVISVDSVPKEMAACKGAKDPLHPLVVEWSAAEKVSLDGASRRGLVAVAFDGCSLRVVRGCDVRGSYAESDVTPDRKKAEMHDRDDLFAILPLAAPKLGASLTAGKSLALDYVVVAERASDASSVETSGDCADATHWVKKIRLGAYSLDMQSNANAEAHADLGPLTAGGTHQEADARSKSSGDPAACEASPKDDRCRAPVALELVPLAHTPPRPGSEPMMMRDR